MKNRIFIGFIALMLSFLMSVQSCKVGEDYERQEMPVPESFRQDFPKDSAISNIPWRSCFRILFSSA